MAESGGNEPPVYLRLEGVAAQMSAAVGTATVTVVLPRQLARELGLVQR